MNHVKICAVSTYEIYIQRDNETKLCSVHNDHSKEMYAIIENVTQYILRKRTLKNLTRALAKTPIH